MSESNKLIAQRIFQKYYTAFDGEIQGCCLVIADEIKKVIGGEVVAGFLCMCGIERSHWWIEKDGEIFDPMGDKYKNEINFHRREEHRDFEIFLSLLPRYEKYRI